MADYFKNTILRLRSSYYYNVIRIMKEVRRRRGKERGGRRRSIYVLASSRKNY